MADAEMAPAAPTPAEPVTAGLNPLSAVPAPPSEPVTAGLDPLPPAASAEAPPADASAVWPPTKPVQTTLERCELLLTPSMAARGPKGYAWVPVHDFGLVVEQFEERKRARKYVECVMAQRVGPVTIDENGLLRLSCSEDPRLLLWDNFQEFARKQHRLPVRITCS